MYMDYSKTNEQTRNRLEMCGATWRNVWKRLRCVGSCSMRLYSSVQVGRQTSGYVWNLSGHVRTRSKALDSWIAEANASVLWVASEFAPTCLKDHRHVWECTEGWENVGNVLIYFRISESTSDRLGNVTNFWAYLEMVRSYYRCWKQSEPLVKVLYSMSGSLIFGCSSLRTNWKCTSTFWACLKLFETTK